MPAAKKYKLFSIKEGAKPICAFFLSPAGCRNGHTCPFLHDQHQGERKGGGCTEASDSASTISSESEEDCQRNMEKDKPIDASKHMPHRDCEQEKRKKKRTENSEKDHGNPFASPQSKGSAMVSTSSSPNRKKKPRHAASEIESRSCNKKQSESQGHTKTSNQNSNVSCGGEYRSFASHLPVAPFATSMTKSRARESSFSTAPQPKNLEKTSYLADQKRQELPIPTSTAGGRKWQAAVLRTREHERYSSCFDFANYKQKHREAGIQSDWITARKFGQWCSSNPQAIAIDCEVCETQDPLSGSKNTKALCRVSVVNAECPAEVLLDTLVKPNWPVSDYRTRINGIKKEHLDNVQFTLRHAQAFMMALCSDETVVVGHAVHNDLIALNMEHQCIADSSFLFHAKDSGNAAVSLRELVSSIFQEKMPETHDSVNDARKALGCVVNWLRHSGKVPEILRSTNNAKCTQLFVHRVPKYCKAKNICSMFQTHTDIVPQRVNEVEFPGTMGTSYVTFRTSRHAKLAFDTLDGCAEPDKSGRLQKKVYLKTGDYVRIRKMVHENAANLDSTLNAIS